MCEVNSRALGNTTAFSSLERSSVEFPKLLVHPPPTLKHTVLSKPYVPSQTSLSKLPAAHSCSSLSVDLDLDLRETRKKVAFLLNKTNSTLLDTSAIFPKPTYQGKCVLCRNNIGDPHTHYKSPNPRTLNYTDQPTIRRNSITMPPVWANGDEPKKLKHQANQSTTNIALEKKDHFQQLNENNAVVYIPKKEIFKDISLSQNRTIKNNEDIKDETTPKQGRGLCEERRDNNTPTGDENCGMDDKTGKTISEHFNMDIYANFTRRVDTPKNKTRSIRTKLFENRADMAAERARRVSLGKWCDCGNIDLTEGECRECGAREAHETWCRFKTGECPDCGKPIKGKYHVKFRSQSTHSLRTSPTNPSTTSSEDLSEVEAINNLASSTFLNSHKSKSEIEWVKDEDANRDNYGRVNGNKEEQSSDYNIHKQAYLQALSDSRLQRWRSNPSAIQNSSLGYFSYFPPLWSKPNPEVKVTSSVVPKIGVRGQEDTLKIKDPMKHIFGSVKLSEYYPSGRKFPGLTVPN